MSDNTMSKMIKLKSSNGKEFEVSEALLVEHSKTICHFIETVSTENSIPPGDVTAPIIEKMLEYCRKHFEAGDAAKTETTVKGCIKDDDFAAKEEECASIISGLKISSEEKGDASKTETAVKGCIKDDDLTAEKEECASIISGLSSEEKGDASKTETTAKGCIKDDDFAAEKEESTSIISGLSSEEKDSTTSKMIKLKSSDGKVFEVSETVAQQSQTICHLIESASTENSIQLLNVTVILEKVFEYCKRHVGAADASKTQTTDERCINSDEELEKWDKQFVDDIDKAAMLLDLIMAANYLYIEGLLDVTCRKMADNVMGKSTEEIRQAFNIEDDDQEECDSINSGLTGSDEKKRKKKKNKQKKKK